MDALIVATIAVIEWEQSRNKRLHKIGEVLKKLCRESAQTADTVWAGMRGEKTLAAAKAAVMEYAREHDGCTEEDALRVLRELRELYGVEKPITGRKTYDVV